MPDQRVLGIMQPYFFPYLGHFSLIAAVDEWVVFDISQYTPKTWMNRNRILHPDAGWQYITLPLSNASISIKTWQARLLNPADAKKNILGKLSHYRRSAPYYRDVIDLVSEVFESTEGNSLVNLNVRALAVVCEYLGLPFNYRICSELALVLPENLRPGDWALEICSALGASGYINPSSGRHLFDVGRFAQRGIGLNIIEPADFVYDTGPYRFEPALSIIDVMMWNAPDAVLEALQHRHIHRLA